MNTRPRPSGLDPQDPRSSSPGLDPQAGGLALKALHPFHSKIPGPEARALMPEF